MELLKARTDTAVCSNPADAEMIRSRIQDLGGCKALSRWHIFSLVYNLSAVVDVAATPRTWPDTQAGASRLSGSGLEDFLLPPGVLARCLGQEGRIECIDYCGMSCHRQSQSKSLAVPDLGSLSVPFRVRITIGNRCWRKNCSVQKKS